MLNNKTIRNQIFSITDNYHNNVKRIVITILGIKIKFKRKIIDNIRYLLKQSSIVENNGENNKFIVLDENGNKTGIKYIKNIGIKFYGNNNIVKLYKGFKTSERTIIGLHKNAKLTIEASPYEINFRVPGWIADGCSLNIGKNSSISNATFLILDEPNVSITLSKNCMLSSGIVFRSSDAHIIVDNISNQRINYPADINVGEHTWIGMGTIILKGANIPSNSIIGAHSIYTKSSNPLSLDNWNGGVFVGQPAKLKKTNVTWYRDENEYKQAQKPHRCRERESNPSISL